MTYDDYQKQLHAIIDPHVVQLQGRDYVQVAGLVAAARHLGVRGIESEQVSGREPPVIITNLLSKGRKYRKKQDDEMLANWYLETQDASTYGYWFKATVTMEDGGRFVAHGSCTLSNCKEQMTPHMHAMAETRAIGRALRNALGVGLCTEEELADDPAPRGPSNGAAAGPTEGEKHKGVLAQIAAAYGVAADELGGDDAAKQNVAKLVRAWYARLGLNGPVVDDPSRIVAGLSPTEARIVLSAIDKRDDGAAWPWVSMEDAATK